MEKKILISHVIPSIDKSYGGPARSVTQLISEMLIQSKAIIELNTFHSKDALIEDFNHPNGKINFFSSNDFGWSKQCNTALNTANPDIYHGHGLWHPMNHQMAKAARRNNIPYLISTRGMLDTWSINHKRFKKKLALQVFQRKDLNNAVCLHATALQEAKNIRASGYKNPIAVIPNGISLDKFLHCKKEIKEKRNILLLSRIVKNKGVEELIKAFSALDNLTIEPWNVKIIGNIELSYKKELIGLITTNNLQNKIFIEDPVYGEDKKKALHAADIFVLPSYTENFGIVVAEALASNTPVITTTGTPWKILEEKNCGWWIKPGVEPLIQTLKVALNSTPERLEQMGKNGREVIEHNFSIQSVAGDMWELYSWILGKTPLPSFVHLD